MIGKWYKGNQKPAVFFPFQSTMHPILIKGYIIQQNGT